MLVFFNGPSFQQKTSSFQALFMALYFLVYLYQLPFDFFEGAVERLADVFVFCIRHHLMAEGVHGDFHLLFEMLVVEYDMTRGNFFGEFFKPVDFGGNGVLQRFRCFLVPGSDLYLHKRNLLG